MKTVIYPGSFDPITNGHYHIIEKASKLFDKVIVVVSINPSKKDCMFTLKERANLIKHVCAKLKNVEVDINEGYTIDYCKKVNAVGIVKGLRNDTDFEDEYKQFMFNSSKNSEIETILLLSDEKYHSISSSLVKKNLKEGICIDNLVDPYVKKALIEKMMCTQ